MALTLLLAGGVSTVSLLSAAVQSQAALAGREVTLREADRMLAALTLLSKDDLDRRLGQHAAGRFLADVRRPDPARYRISLRESETGSEELLVTVVHRPDQEAP